MISAARLLLSANRGALATILWTIAVMLLLGDTFGEWRAKPGTLGRWALLIGLMATCVTVSVMINHARAVVLECMSWEHKTMRAETSAALHIVPVPRR